MKIPSRPHAKLSFLIVRLTVLIGLAGFLFAACAGQSSAAVLGGSIQYSKSGGIAGIEESMKIDRDGKGLIERKRFRLSARQAKSLAAAIRRADLERAKSPKGGSCCDFFQYEIRYRGRTVSWDENSEDELSRARARPAGDARRALRTLRVTLARRPVRRTGPTLLVSVEPDRGLLPEHADVLREWVRSTGWS